VTPHLHSVEIASVGAPASPIYRVTKVGRDPFEPPPIDMAGDNRFDDPGRIFSVVYCASDRAGAFGETVARFRRSLPLLKMLEQVEDDEPLDEALFGLIVPGHPEKGVVPADWRFKRQIGATLLSQDLRFADILAPASLTCLRRQLGPLAQELGYPDLDASTMLSSWPRQITQAAARYVYERLDENGTPTFAGIRYQSRLNLDWTCWAIFSDRIIHSPRLSETSLDPMDSDLLEAASALDLCIEGIRDKNHFICP